MPVYIRRESGIKGMSFGYRIGLAWVRCSPNKAPLAFGSPAMPRIPDRSTVRRLRDVLVRGLFDVQGFSKRREERAWLLLQYPSNVQARSLEE